MLKRISAIMLAVILLFSIIPTEVYAVVYELGQQLWGSTSTPTEETAPGTKWEPKTDDNGLWISQPGTCTKDHEHSWKCELTSAEYLWWVVPKKNSTTPTTPPEPSTPGGDGEGGGTGEGGDLEPGGSGNGGEPGSVSFQIHTVGSDGADLAGVTYILYEYYTDPETKKEQRTFVFNEDIQNDLLKQISENNEKALEDLQKLEEQQLQDIAENKQTQVDMESHVQQVNSENQDALDQLDSGDYRADPVTTDSTGTATFNHLEQYMEKDETTVTWYLVQDAAAFKDEREDNPLNQYVASNQVWEITITRGESNSYNYSITPQKPSSLEEIEGHKEGYDSTTNTLTVINKRDLCGFYFDVIFEGLETGIPKDMTANISVTGSNNVDEDIPFPVPATEINNGWQSELLGLDPGEYSVNAEQPVSSSLTGYTYVGATYSATRPDPANPGKTITTEGETDVTLSEESSHAIYTITYHYEASATKPNQPSTPAEASNTIVLKSMVDNRYTISGAKFGLFADKTTNSLIRKYTDSIDDLEAAEGETVTYFLRQTDSPVGYTLSTDVYKVTVKNRNGKTTVTLVKDGLLDITADRDTNGDWLAVFNCSPKNAVQIELECEVYVDFKGNSWRDKSLENQYRNQTYEFILEWGNKQQTTLSLKHGERKKFNVELPSGTEYNILEPDLDVDFDFTNNRIGSTSTETITVSVDVNYMIEPGDDLNLYMLKVDSKSKNPLEDATFSLRDPDNDELKVYKTKKDGEINIEGMFRSPGTYTLKETEAPEGYSKLNKPVTIDVSVDYTSIGNGVWEQNWYADVSHKSGEWRDDGTYLIKNSLAGDNPKTGDSFDAALWVRILTISVIGLTYVMFAASRKSRKTR